LGSPGSFGKNHAASPYWPFPLLRFSKTGHVFTSSVCEKMTDGRNVKPRKNKTMNFSFLLIVKIVFIGIIVVE
jgi:hypothetical protein